MRVFVVIVSLREHDRDRDWLLLENNHRNRRHNERNYKEHRPYFVQSANKLILIEEKQDKKLTPKVFCKKFNVNTESLFL